MYLCSLNGNAASAQILINFREGAEGERGNSLRDWLWTAQLVCASRQNKQTMCQLQLVCVCVCVCTTLRIGYGTAQTATWPQSGQQSKRFSTCFQSRLPCQREREGGLSKEVHKCMAHSSFQFIFLYFCHFLFHYVSSRASNVLSYLPSAIFWLFALFFVFLYFCIFIQGIVIFSASTWVACLALFPAPLAITKG